MKYEYLCGYESDFFAMPANVIAVVRLDHCVQGLTEFNQIIECGKPVLAMRRIIAEPNRWTVEDKKAGRLPEVGAMSIGKRTKLEYEVVAVTEKQIIMKCTDGMCSVYGHDAFIAFFEPIETPEEKAQREEDEFISSLRSVEIHGGTVSGFFKQGARAAYRKLKGGE